MTYYDDNYGHWDNTNDADVVEFYHYVQKNSVIKACEKCGREVQILQDYVICNSCADKMEHGGWDY